MDSIRDLLEKHPDWLNVGDDFGRTPLIQAVLSRHREVFSYLLSQGADVNRLDKEGMAALHLACYMGLDLWVEQLLQKGADADAQNNVLRYTPLHLAVKGGCTRCVEMLLAKGASLERIDGQGNTPLLLAATQGGAEIVRFLLAKGASAKDKDPEDSTALHLAALNGHKEIVSQLIAAGVPLNKKNGHKNTALQIALREQYPQVARLLLLAGAKGDPWEMPKWKGEYLAQKKPASIPLVFADGIVSTEKKELNSVFTPDGKEFYFTVKTPAGPWKIMVMKEEKERWTQPRTASFSGTWSDVDLFLSPDGSRLFFCSNRPPDEKGHAQDNYDIWVSQRKGTEWSDPVNLGSPVNSGADEFYPSITREGTLYFQSVRSDGRGDRDLYRSRLDKGVYRTVENLGDAINSTSMEGDALIAPDEEYLVFSSNRPGGSGQGDLHLSFRNSDGTWTEPKNLGPEINTAANENCPILSPDGKFLFFTRSDDIWWVSSAVLQKFLPSPSSGTGERK